MGRLKPYSNDHMGRILTQKGFIEDRSRDHSFYYLKTSDVVHRSVFVKISHGTHEPGLAIMSKIKRRMKFSNSSDFCKYMDCTMSKEEYIQMLKSIGII